MAHMPVLKDGYEADIWNRLTSGKGGAFGKSDLYIQLTEIIVKMEGTVSSAVLSHLIERLYKVQSSDLDSHISQLLSKCRPNDCIPALTAALIYADLGRPDKA